MSYLSGKNSNNILGYLLLGFIVILIALTIFASQFFTSENKLKIAFENGQTISFFIAMYNEEKEIKLSTVVYFNTETNRVVTVYLLPETYLSFGKAGYFTIKDVLKQKVNKEEIKNGIGRLLNKKVDYYFFVEKDNFIKLIDILGGVDVYSEELYEPQKNIYIPPGVSQFDGDKVLEFLSLELKDENEYDKLKRHQYFMRGFLKLKDDFLENFTSQIITSHIYKLFSTNLSVNDLLIIYSEINNRFKSGINDYSRNIINKIVYCDRKNIGEGRYVLLPKKSGNWIKTEIKDAISDLEKEESAVSDNKTVVQILNGTEITGFASRAKSYLESYGFDVLEIANAENSNYDNTVIIIRNSEVKARRLSNLIKCKHVVEGEDISNRKIDVTLILGKDFDGKVVKN